ncbi:L-amino acid oxidase-like isoform X2 [Dysidea avara]|uniref:L-amino acid oxidase-like isoform X2 n=1 Tax=Dysidea avara TaxID=196820 RepID=UPI00332A7A5D
MRLVITWSPVATKMAAEQKETETSERITPDWVTGNLGSYLLLEKMLGTSIRKATLLIPDVIDLDKLRVQQSDLLKPLLMDIAQFGLNYAYKKFLRPDDVDEADKFTSTRNPKKVIIVGAGIAGLSAGYELSKVGHDIEILEMQTRLGGRVKTFGEKEGFAKHCYAEGGAMRLPDQADSEEKIHYLTDYYVTTEFGLKTLPFNNADDHAWLKFYGNKKIQISDWNKDPEANFNYYWPGWDKRICGTGAKEKYRIQDIDTYYALTTNIAANQLKKRLLVVGDTNKREAIVWEQWIENWSKFSLASFLRNTLDGVLQLLDKEHQLSAAESEMLDELIPWPEEAITAYSVFSYTEQLDQSLVQYLRDQLGQWWSNEMHKIDGGASRLPEAFAKERKLDNWSVKAVNLQNKITYNVTVNEVIYDAKDHNNPHTWKVKVKGYHTSSGTPFEIDGDAVIIAVPLYNIRSIKFVSESNTTPPSWLTKIYKAVEDIWQGPATKIMLQCKTRFWEKEGIKGGCSKTNLPVGQIHYPTYTAHPKSNRGILMCYTWKAEALAFAAFQPHIAIQEAVRQVEEIHPQIRDQFEVGAVQAWTNDPSAQGAYALLKPYQYKNVRTLMVKPCLNMYFAGDGISFAAGWIQGALESGLRAAYQFYYTNESNKPVPKQDFCDYGM